MAVPKKRTSSARRDYSMVDLERPETTFSLQRRFQRLRDELHLLMTIALRQMI